MRIFVKSGSISYTIYFAKDVPKGAKITPVILEYIIVFPIIL